MNRKLKVFFNLICLNETISQEAREDRAYAVVMYMLNIEKSITAQEADEIMETVRAGNQFPL